MPSDNPHEPSSENSDNIDTSLPYPLGRVYWRNCLAALLINLALILPWYRLTGGKPRLFVERLVQSPTFGLGIFGLLVTGFATAYGTFYAQRVVRRLFIRRYNEIRENQFNFFMQGIAIGVLIAATNLTAFVCCCFPIGMASISYSAGSGISGNVSGAVTVAVLFALIVGGIMVLMILPREDRR